MEVTRTGTILKLHWLSISAVVHLVMVGRNISKPFKHAIKEKKIKARNMDVNTNLVSAAVQVCKIKAASMAYKSMVGSISSCGADVGNIGHGR